MSYSWPGSGQSMAQVTTGCSLMWISSIKMPSPISHARLSQRSGKRWHHQPRFCRNCFVSIQRRETMSTNLFRTLTALSGIVGVIMLIISFNINPGPPDNATSAQLIAFGNQYFASILWGSWLQAVGPLLIVLFAFAIVCLAGATTRFAGWMTLFGGAMLMTVSLVEIVFYMSTLNPTPLNNNPAAMALISLALIHSVQHLYFIVGAPALFIPLGVVILGSRVLPHVFGYLAIA